jgi:biopolymer transport protein ExbD
MAQSQPDPQGGLIAGINVTPLVDVVLVLLIIFMVTAKLIVTPAVPVDLPRAVKSEDVQEVFSLVLPVRGPILVNGQPAVDDAVLLGKARAALARNKQLRAVIHADGGVAHRKVVHALDLLKQAGIARVAFGALREEGTGEKEGGRGAHH